jgi:hypothetical protein
MTQADSVLSTPPTNTPADTTRRHFLLAVAGGSAAMLAATLAEPAATASQLDPASGLIEAHRTARAAHLAAIDEQNRLERLGDSNADWVTDGPCHADIYTSEHIEPGTFGRSVPLTTR